MKTVVVPCQGPVPEEEGEERGYCTTMVQMVMIVVVIRWAGLLTG